MRYRPAPWRILGSIATTLATTAALTAATEAPAHAADIPAYGVITITNDGIGAIPVWTYDSAFWDCGTHFLGPYVAPTAVTVTCDANGGDGPSFACPLMVLTTQTRGPAARAGGSVSCTRYLDTGIVSGVGSAQAAGDLGRAWSIECRAYGGDVPLVPPYTVTCSEPGLPGGGS